MVGTDTIENAPKNKELVIANDPIRDIAHYRSVVTLQGGHSIFYCYHTRTVRKRLQDARILRERFRYAPGAGLPLLSPADRVIPA